MPNNNPFDAAVMKGLKLPMDTEITNSDFSSTLKGLEKLYGQKRVLASDYYTFIEKVAKKTNLKQLQDDLKTAKEGTQLRIDLEKKLQTTISEIQKKAYEGAAAKYRNVYNLTFTEVAVNANKTLMKQEQDYRKSLDDK